MRKKLLCLISLLVSVLILSGCKEPETPPTETPSDGDTCGVGTGNYYFTKEGEVPSNFNANTQTIFTISLKPTIDNSYNTDPDRFNRLYFELEKDFEIYRSNYVEFKSDNTNTQELEWGGSLPSGEYEINAYMKNIQLDSSCPDSVYKEEEYYLGDINITQFSNPQKVMYIEYDCQSSDTSIIYYYDVFSSPKTEEYIDIAFNIANTKDTIDIIAYPGFYDAELVEATDQKVKEYIAHHKQFPEHMYLGGIKGFKNESGTYLYYITGWAVWDSITNAPNCSTGSLVAVKACIDVVANRYKINYNDFVTATTIHELGHQRGFLTHFNHVSEFCIMNLGLVVVGERNRYSNPHFCNECITKLKNVEW